MRCFAYSTPGHTAHLLFGNPRVTGTHTHMRSWQHARHTTHTSVNKEVGSASMKLQQPKTGLSSPRLSTLQTSTHAHTTRGTYHVHAHASQSPCAATATSTAIGHIRRSTSLRHPSQAPSRFLDMRREASIHIPGGIGCLSAVRPLTGWLRPPTSTSRPQ